MAHQTNPAKHETPNKPIGLVKNSGSVTRQAASPSVPAVGIGASAGGLAAFEAFFSGMPADKCPGMAFVLVQHLAPNHKSILAELIRRYTRMQAISTVRAGLYPASIAADDFPERLARFFTWESEGGAYRIPQGTHARFHG
ncbi:chemotaxis protein CheB [Fundidesulfovibrio soli]|uniref:chemotaxis protein CheB n=1 Tax=Fundidesulfovibrio soli TaxID=2922716 RepID=UPI001FB02CF6|nr:chemotaxis protein CheB [Fundidesulfovibrio soli]